MLTKLAEALVALLKVKSLVTFVIVAVFSVLALRGAVSPDNVKDVALMVFAFYFGTQTEKGKAQ